MEINGDFVLSAAFTILLLAFGHYFKWGIGFFARSEVALRLFSYVYGLLSIMAGMSILAYLGRSGWEAVWEVAAFSIVGGAATVLFYGVDWIGMLITRAVREEKLKRVQTDGEKRTVSRVEVSQGD